MRIRPMEPADVVSARAVAFATLPTPDHVDDEQRARFSVARIERILGTDPGGCWVAEDDDGAIAGVAVALVRDGIWVLSYLAVSPDVQERGTGRGLLDAALGHAAGARGALVASSVDPRAMRLYSLAGFDLRPCVAMAGIVDRAAIPAGLRSRPAGRDALELAAEISRPIRGGAYDPEDLALYLDADHELLRAGDDGVALHGAGTAHLLVARDEEAAADLLWSVLAASPNGATVETMFVTAGQDWAIRTALRARLALSPDGPLFVRGELGPLRPWLPGGAFL